MAMSGSFRANHSSSVIGQNEAYFNISWFAQYVAPSANDPTHRYIVTFSYDLVHTNYLVYSNTSLIRTFNNSGAGTQTSSVNISNQDPGTYTFPYETFTITLTKRAGSDYIYDPPSNLSFDFSTGSITFTGGNYPGIYASASFAETGAVINLDSVNTAPITITGSSSNITTTSATLNAVCMQGEVPVSSAASWYYKLDNGSWTTISGTGSSKSVTVTGLQQNSTHTYQFSAVVDSNTITSASYSFTTLEAAAPIVSLTLSNQAANSFTINASANETCNTWQYRLTSSGSWVNFDNAISGTSSTQQITGLTYGSTYQVQVRATSTSSSKVGTSSASSYTANEPTTFVSDAISVDYTSPMTIPINVSPSSAYQNTHTINIITNGVGRILASNTTLTNGVNNIQVPADILSWIGSYLSGQSSADFTLSLSTWGPGGGTVGSTQTATLTVSIPSSEAPSFSNFTYEAQGGTALSGNNQYLVQGYSAIHINASSASAHAGSTLVSYSVTYGGENLGSYTNANITTPVVSSNVTAGTNTLSVTVTDSFGRSTTVTKQVTLMPYSKIQLKPVAAGDIERVESDTYNRVKITVEGNYASSKIGNTEKNALTSFYYQYVTTDSTSWSSAVDITPVLTGTNFKIIQLQIELPSLDSSYYIRFTASDKLTTDTVMATIATKVPLVSFRKGMVGINNKNPNSALDVLGEIEMNGFNVQGFVRVVSNEDLDVLLKTGIYVAEQDASYSSHHYPTNSRGIIEILPESQGLVQRFTKVPTDGKMWIRHYNTSTTSFGTWSQISGSGSFTQVQSNWNEEDTTDPSYIQNKPFEVVDNALTPNGTNPVEGGAIYSAVESKAPKASGIYYVAGSGSTAGSSTSGSRRSARWRGTNSDITSYFSGLTVNFKIDVEGIATYGTVLDINSLGEHPVLRNVSTMIGTAYAVGCIVTLTYDADATGTVYTNNTSATITGAWKVADYDSNSNTVPSAYCTTAATTAAKTATCTNYALETNSYLHVLIQNANSVEGAITLNVNSKGAIPIYINGEASSATNHTLPGGTYITYYDGTAYHFRTDGKLPGKILDSDHADSADQVPWSGIQNRPTLSHVTAELVSGTTYNIVISSI